MNVVVYMRIGCSKCEQAVEMLRQHRLSPQLINIAEHAQLARQYDCCVPVVVIDGKIRFRGRVNQLLLRRILDHQRKSYAEPATFSADQDV